MFRRLMLCVVFLVQSHLSRLDSVEDVRRVSRCKRRRRAFGRRGVATHRRHPLRSLIGIVRSDGVSKEVGSEALNGTLDVLLMEETKSGVYIYCKSINQDVP